NRVPRSSRKVSVLIHRVVSRPVFTKCSKLQRPLSAGGLGASFSSISLSVASARRGSLQPRWRFQELCGRPSRPPCEPPTSMPEEIQFSCHSGQDLEAALNVVACGMPGRGRLPRLGEGGRGPSLRQAVSKFLWRGTPADLRRSLQPVCHL